MLTAAQQHAVDHFAKSLLALSDDALIDTYHQAAEDHRAAQAEGSDNVVNACEQKRASEKAMRDRFLDYQSRYELRYPLNQFGSPPPVPIVPIAHITKLRSATWIEHDTQSSRARDPSAEQAELNASLGSCGRRQ
jgi:hypothetical protein